MDDQQLRYELDVGAVVMRESILRVVNTLKSGGARGGAGSGAGDKLLRGSGGARKTNKGESPYESTTEAASRQSPDATRPSVRICRAKRSSVAGSRGSL